MGTARLRTKHQGKFNIWIRRVGFRTELEFWQSLSGLQKGTVVDHMVAYLSTLGYSGNPNDQFAHFLRDQVGPGSLFDMANKFFDGSFSGASSSNDILLEDGSYVLMEDGTKVAKES